MVNANFSFINSPGSISTRGFSTNVTHQGVQDFGVTKVRDGGQFLAEET